MGKNSLRVALVLTASIMLGCEDAPVEYATDNPGGYLHSMSTDPVVIFQNKVGLGADLEARGVQPPVGNASWHIYWMKIIDYWTQQGTVGAHSEVAAYVVQQRRARNLPRL